MFVDFSSDTVSLVLPANRSQIGLLYFKKIKASISRTITTIIILISVENANSCAFLFIMYTLRLDKVHPSSLRIDLREL